jgi:hypothetical protein
MSRCRSHTSLFIFGAAAGAAAALFLVPSTRRILATGIRRVLFELREGDLVSPDGITQEAGAVEGGLAATRRWSESYSGS